MVIDLDFILVSIMISLFILLSIHSYELKITHMPSGSSSFISTPKSYAPVLSNPSTQSIILILTFRPIKYFNLFTYNYCLIFLIYL